MSTAVVHLLLAGVLLAALEVGWVLVRARALFLSFGERASFALACAAGAASCVLLLGLALAWSARSRGARSAWALAWMACAGWLSWWVSDGRRVKDLAARPFAVAALAAAVGLAMWCLPRALRVERRWWLAVCALLPAWGALYADATVLPRGYPAFHLGLMLAACLFAALAALWAPPHAGLPPRRAWALAAVVPCFALFMLARLASNPTAGFAVRESAPFTAKLMQPFTPQRVVTSTGALAPTVVTGAHGVDLRDRDVLLVTVDALRADMLRAYGGRGQTPELDRLASESMVFTHAYTPAPHTSYALASLLTGKFVKPLVELGGKLGDPPTLPDRLRRYGYRTAAFYPPAIFFVDGASFEPLQKRGFGFEYRKEMFAPAPDRVAQLEEYLAGADAKRPLFVWVHLFEPHEPYAPPADVPHDGSERGRYEAEVKVCDGVIAQLIAKFRAARPRATVIVTADHGEEFGDHGGSFHGSTLYEEQVHVPLLWSSPGAVTPGHTDVPVELTDLGTTILSTAHIPRDAHMRGDELGGVLAGEASGPRYAFSSIEARHMVTDGRRKLICVAGAPDCALFDLVSDPRETHNIAAQQPADVARLRPALDAFLGSIARGEALTVGSGVRMPDALAQAKLSGAADVAALLPLLADSQVSVRLETARVLGELGDVRALAALERARAHDDDAAVRSEAAVAALQLGSRAALDDAHAALAQPERARRAALALASAKDERALPVLEDWLRDENATESERLRVVRALSELGSQRAVAPLARALTVVRLREAAARALGQLGGSEAQQALCAALDEERYPPARAAEAQALAQLGEPTLPARIRHYLGMESSLPLGIRELAQLGALTPSSRAGALLADADVREGEWSCGGETVVACAPGRAARVRLPRRGATLRGPVRVTLWVRDATPGSELAVDGRRFALTTREDQLSFVTSSAPERISFAGAVPIAGLVVAPSVPEIPPPPPEPWEADASVSENAPVR